MKQNVSVAADKATALMPPDHQRVSIQFTPLSTGDPCPMSRPPGPTRSRLFKFVTRLFVTYLLALFGFTIFCLLALIFKADDLVRALAEPVGTLFLQLAAFNACLWLVTVVVESLRQR